MSSSEFHERLKSKDLRDFRLGTVATSDHETTLTQRQALQSDLQQDRAFNLFSKESQDAIKAAGNTELYETVDVEPEAQCRA